MKRLMFVCFLVCFLGFASSAGALVLTFDDVDNGVLADGYGGLNWDMVAVGQAIVDDGFQNSSVSGTQFAYNRFGSDATVSGSVFDFNGAYFSARSNDALEIVVTGSREGTEIYSDTLTVNANSAEWYEFNYIGIDSIAFSTNWVSGTMADHQFSMDDFTINETASAPVPEPATILLLGSGLVCVVGRRRRKIA